jgi:hypothetical protein
VILNRRKFFKWLGAGTAAAVATPYVAKAIETPLSGKDPWSNYTEPDWSQTSCSCSGRSFYEGRCPYCEMHKLECGCTRGQCTCKVLQYSDYASFSQFAIAAALDEQVSKAAEELGRQAGLHFRALQKAVPDVGA